MAVPLAIFDASSQLRTGNKSVLMELLSSGTERPRGRSTLVVDGEALVMALGRPSEHIDDLGDKFVKAVLASGKDFYRMDVTFDRYRETSIARLERSVLEATHPFEELLKMAQYHYPSPGPALWLSMTTRQI